MTLVHLCLQNHKLYFPAKANKSCDLPPLVSPNCYKGFSLLTYIYYMTVCHHSVLLINFSIFFIEFNTVQNILSFFKQCDYCIGRSYTKACQPLRLFALLSDGHTHNVTTT